MALAEPRARRLLGKAKPRLAPPMPARTAVADYQAEAERLGMPLLPWQTTVGRYLYALGRDEHWLYPEVAAVVSRQNGKTKLLKPHVMRRLRMGRRILHAAQTRTLPRRLFKELVPVVMREFPSAIIRLAGGQESIEIPPSDDRPNGALYLIAAATSGGARGIDAIDDLLLDEVRELDEDFMAAAVPTTIASLNPQIFYLSNAGHDTTDVLNAIRKRAEDGDPALAYLEWSASPERSVDNRVGWSEANPSLGHEVFPGLLARLEQRYVSAHISGSMAHFETEHLCRWVRTMRDPLFSIAAWQACRAELPAPTRSFMGVSMDPGSKRASAAIAWPIGSDAFGLQLILDGTGNPIEPDLLGPDLRETARKYGVQDVGFDPLTDQALAKFFPRSKPVAGQAYANASSRFVAAVESGKLRWADCQAVGEDLSWTARKEHDESGSFQAVRAADDRPITAALAAIRAVWLAASPRPVPGPRQPQAVGF